VERRRAREQERARESNGERVGEKERERERARARACKEAEDRQDRSKEDIIKNDNTQMNLTIDKGL